MTTTDSHTLPPFNLSKAFMGLFRPRNVFAHMANEARAAWLMPMIVLSLTNILATVTAGYLRTRAAMMGEIPLPLDWQYWSPEMQNDYMQAQQATQGPVFMYIIPLVSTLIGLWLGWLIFAGLLHLGSTLLGGRGSMQSAFNVVAWASLPFAIRDILRIIFMLATGQTITSPGLSGFAANPGIVAQLLARIDIFLLWNVIILMFGLVVFDGLPKSKSLAGVVVVTLLVLLTQAGLGALFTNLGGTVVQRPFF